MIGRLDWWRKPKKSKTIKMLDSITAQQLRYIEFTVEFINDTDDIYAIVLGVN